MGFTTALADWVVARQRVEESRETEKIHKTT